MPKKRTGKKVPKKTAKTSAAISGDTVKHVAYLAKINISASEAKKMEKDLNEILNSFKILDKLDVKKVEPSFQPLPVKDVFREDKIEDSLSQEKALSNTKHKDKGYFKGPRVV